MRRAAKQAPCWLTADSSFSTRRSIGALRRPSIGRRPRTPACAACWRRERRGSGEGRGRGDRRAGVLRTLQAADIGGIRAILVHAVSEDAKRFYESCGFAVSPLDPLTLMITVADAEKALRRG